MPEWMHVPGPVLESGRHDEVNLVFARGMTPETLAEGLRELRREHLVGGEADGWVWVVHDMFNAEVEDYDPVPYGRICAGAELVVFVTEPCSAKAHPPHLEYYRDGRLITWFSFEDLTQRLGDNPDYLSAELLAANLIGPDAECAEADDARHDCFDHHYEDHDRIVRAVAGFFALPSPPLSPAVTDR
ncbi:hypothetical protein ABZ192_21035 [Streptomyces sp. NPDC006235]|uniref:hypothetical protein n=1 Tax=Streptomyces sp. NPDC006235 TaxID=3156736 RepID=UPI0033A7ED25